MASKHLSQSDFFAKLASLFSARQDQDHGAIHLSQKRLSPVSASTSLRAGDDLADLNPSAPQPILIRASNGKSKESRVKKIKISTVVQSDELDAFYAKYADVCKAGMSALKKRDRKGRKAKKKGKSGVGAATEGEKKN